MQREMSKMLRGIRGSAAEDLLGRRMLQTVQIENGVVIFLIILGVLVGLGLLLLVFLGLFFLTRKFFGCDPDREDNYAVRNKAVMCKNRNHELKPTTAHDLASKGLPYYKRSWMCEYCFETFPTIELGPMYHCETEGCEVDVCAPCYRKLYETNSLPHEATITDVDGSDPTSHVHISFPSHAGNGGIYTGAHLSLHPHKHEDTQVMPTEVLGNVPTDVEDHLYSHPNQRHHQEAPNEHHWEREGRRSRDSWHNVEDIFHQQRTKRGSQDSNSADEKEEMLNENRRRGSRDSLPGQEERRRRGSRDNLPGQEEHRRRGSRDNLPGQEEHRRRGSRDNLPGQEERRRRDSRDNLPGQEEHRRRGSRDSLPGQEEHRRRGSRGQPARAGGAQETGQQGQPARARGAQETRQQRQLTRAGGAQETGQQGQPARAGRAIASLSLS